VEHFKDVVSAVVSQRQMSSSANHWGQIFSTARIYLQSHNEINMNQDFDDRKLNCQLKLIEVTTNIKVSNKFSFCFAFLAKLFFVSG